MRSSLLIIVGVAVAGCNEPPFNAVSISPIYGWVDGCADVKVSGSGFGETVTVKLGDQDLDAIAYPDKDANPLDVGYVVYGQTPPAATGAAGYVTMKVESAGKTAEVKDAFYYVACPSTPYPEAVLSAAEGVAAGDMVTIAGCGFDPSLQVQVGGAAPVAITSVCSTAQASFTAPDPGAGCWYVGFLDSTGTQVFPPPECDITQDCSVSQTIGDTADTGAYDPCGGALTLTYGGAR